MNIGGFSTDYSIIADASGFFRKPFTVTSLSGYGATAGLTTLSFVVTSSSNLGNNDPIIDRVIFERTGTSVAGVPEPGRSRSAVSASWAGRCVGGGPTG